MITLSTTLVDDLDGHVCTLTADLTDLTYDAMSAEIELFYRAWLVFQCQQIDRKNRRHDERLTATATPSTDEVIVA